MKTVEEIVEEINQIGYEYCDNNEDTGISVRGLDKIEEILREWALSIIDECAGSAEYEMVPDDGYTGDEAIYPTHPVLIRATIQAVKDKL